MPYLIATILLLYIHCGLDFWMDAILWYRQDKRKLWHDLKKPKEIAMWFSGFAGGYYLQRTNDGWFSLLCLSAVLIFGYWMLFESGLKWLRKKWQPSKSKSVRWIN